MITVNAYSAYGKRSDTLASATLIESGPELFRFFSGPSQKKNGMKREMKKIDEMAVATP
jgi:hypothetical protein